MILHVTEAKYLRDYLIWLRFNDGAEGEIDLVAEIEGGCLPAENGLYSDDSASIPSCRQSSGRTGPTWCPSSCTRTCECWRNGRQQTLRTIRSPG